jgi:F0F1-type ATP synthase assembly protein I
MGTTPNNDEPTTRASSEPQVRNAVVVLFGDVADTTWRMFFPVVGAAVLGLYIDKSLATTPWVTILLTIVGAVVAALLVRLQIKKVSNK